MLSLLHTIDAYCFLTSIITFFIESRYVLSQRRELLNFHNPLPCLNSSILSDSLIPECRPFRRQITGLVLNVSFWPELEHKMAFVYARKDDVAVASF